MEPPDAQSSLPMTRRQKTSLAIKELWKDPDYRARMTAKRSEIMRQRWLRPEDRARFLAGAQRQWTDANRAQRAAESRKLWTDPTYRELMAVVRRRVATDPVVLAKRRTQMLAAWADPESRARLMSNRNKVIGPCFYCGKPATTIDHMVPLDRGGTNDPANLTPACKPCNGSKGQLTATEYVAKRQRRGLSCTAESLDIS